MKTASLLVVCIVVTAAAGDVAEFELLGFSGDGGILAWMEHGTQDGSGFDYCNAYVVDTASGAVIAEANVVIDPYEYDGGQGLDSEGKQVIQSAVDGAMEIIDPVLAEMGFDGPVAVTHAVSHPLTDLGAPWDVAAFDTVERPDSWCSSAGGTVTVTHTEVPVDSISEWWGFDPILVEVTLEDRLTGDTRVLYHEDELGHGQEYRQACRISDIYTLGDTLVVVVLDVFRLGFEGSDVRHLVVTGDMGFVSAGW